MPRLIAHLLLMLCLILNGIGTAVSAAIVPVDPATESTLQAHSPVELEAPCHDAAPVAPVHDGNSSPASGSSESACCEPDEPCAMAACESVCAQHAIVLPAPVTEGRGEDLGVHYRAVMLPGHDDPSLRRAVRPPIA